MRNKKSELNSAHYNQCKALGTKIPGKVGPYRPFQTSEEEWFKNAEGMFKKLPGKYGEVWNQSGTLLARYDFEKKQVVYVHPHPLELIEQ